MFTLKFISPALTSDCPNREIVVSANQYTVERYGDRDEISIGSDIKVISPKKSNKDGTCCFKECYVENSSGKTIQFFKANQG